MVPASGSRARWECARPCQTRRYPARMPDFDKATVRELARMLDERLKAVETYGGRCPACREAEAHAFLAKLRVLAGDVPAAPALATAGVRLRG